MTHPTSSMPHKTQNSPSMGRIIAYLSAFILLLFLLAIGLAYVSTRFQSPQGWLSFACMLALGSAILWGGWRLMRSESPPRWLAYLLVGAALLRLAAGVLWFVALPVWGHGTRAEINGYVMGDAAGRDLTAWDIAHSKASLWTAFEDNRKVDQYGGLLFLSAWIYRYLGSRYHQPLLIVVLTAAFSALSVLIGWALARRVWGEKVAKITAWILFLYPEAVLLGSSQMREAFTMSLVAASFYGLVRYRDDHSRAGLAWMIVPFLVTLPLTPLSAMLLLGALTLAIFFWSFAAFRHSNVPRLHRSWLWIFLAVLVIIGLIGLWLALRQVVPERITNPVEMVSWWLRKSANLQAYLSEHASGWVQQIFRNTPEWTHLPLLMIYGITQPFLPAAFVVGSHAPVWPWIVAWRALGWTLLLAFLVFAPFHALRRKNRTGMFWIFTLVVWMVILVSAFRGGSDLWDNPRYRAMFVVLQVALAAQIWVEESRTRDPWLRRALLAALAILAVFFPWYLRRYAALSWPVTDPFKTLGIGMLAAFLLALWDWARTEGKGNSSSPDSSPSSPMDVKGHNAPIEYTNRL